VIPEPLADEGLESKIKKLLMKVNLNMVESEKTVLTVSRFIEYLEEIPDRYPYLLKYYDRIRALLRSFDRNSNIFEMLAREENNSLKSEVLENLISIKNGLSSKSGLYMGISRLIEDLNTPYHEEREEGLYYIDDIVGSVVNDRQYYPLTIFYIPDPLTARKMASDFINLMFAIKKFRGVGNKVLMVFDEAQEFIPDRMRGDDYTYQSNVALEMLLRQGRKYFVGGWIATQRVAHLNTNALQQLHSYFVSTLPRSYDRNVISDAFSLSRSVIDKVTELDTGEWIFVSYKATKYKNIPVEIRAPNNEDILCSFLEKH
jgi:hypothetical protein